jgi:hypothetical protein
MDKEKHAPDTELPTRELPSRELPARRHDHSSSGLGNRAAGSAAAALAPYEAMMTTLGEPGGELASESANEQLWRQANLDALTGLPNRYLFQDRLRQELKKAQRDGALLAPSIKSTTGWAASRAMRCWWKRPPASTAACAPPTPWRGWAATSSP